jgi:hypothetical protein
MHGDADGDQDVDGADLLLWQRQPFASNAHPSATPAPEPAAGVILLYGLIVIVGRLDHKYPA